MSRFLPASGRLSDRPIVASRRSLFSWRWQKKYIGLVFIAPWVVAFLAFELLPTVAAFYFSLTNYAVIGQTTFIGLANYQQLFTQDSTFGIALVNTVYYTLLSVPAGLILSFALALLLNVPIRGQGVFRTLFYVPAIVPSVAASVVWLWIFDSDNGLLNNVLASLGLPTVSWLTDPGVTKNALVLLSLWGVGGGMVIFLAGLQTISQDLYEAAAIDGAGGLRKLVSITIPLMTPSIFFNLVLGVINSFQVFNAAYILFQNNGGPDNSVLFYMVYLYQNAFQYLQMGYASAMAVVLFLVILVLTLVFYRSSDRWVFYS